VEGSLGIAFGVGPSKVKVTITKNKIWFPAINFSSIHGVDMKLGV
jgi:hypothetical protein